MKTFKLLLLGGIFTLLGIFNYSSAGSVNYDYSMGSDYILGITETLDGGVVNVNVSSLTNCDSDFPYIFICGTYNGDSCISSQLEITSPGSYILNLESQSVFPYRYLYIGGFCSSNGTLTSSLIEGGNEGGNEGGTGTGLIGQLTPIITGLDNAIVEFIPYVVYVGLGVLGVLIGFFAIKRLIRWIKGNTFSVFNSRKRRK